MKNVYEITVGSKYSSSIDYVIEAESQEVAIILAKDKYAMETDVHTLNSVIVEIKEYSKEEYSIIERRRETDAIIEKQRQLERQKRLDETQLNRKIKNMPLEEQRKELLDYFNDSDNSSLVQYIKDEADRCINRWKIEATKLAEADFGSEYRFPVGNDLRIGKGQCNRGNKLIPIISSSNWGKDYSNALNSLIHFTSGQFLKSYTPKGEEESLLNYKGNIAKDVFSKLKEWNDPEIADLVSCINFIEEIKKTDYMKLDYYKAGFLGSKSYIELTYDYSCLNPIINFLKLMIKKDNLRLSKICVFADVNGKTSTILDKTYDVLSVDIDMNQLECFQGKETFYVPVSRDRYGLKKPFGLAFVKK